VLAAAADGLFNPAVAARKKNDFQPIGSLNPTGASANSILLKSEYGMVEISALDRDVYRLRITQKNRFSKAPSYAVVDSGWTGGDVKPVVLKKSAKLISDLSRLVLNFEDSQFRLTHDCGEAFASASIGFLGKSPQIRLQLDEDEHLFGLGETTGTFNKRGLIREFWNTDVLGHAPAIHPGMRRLYVSIPFAITMRDGVAAGLFWDNPARQRWDMGSTNFNEWKLSADSGEIDLYLFLGPTVENVVNSFGRLTGRMPMPPKWALGFHQCKYSYETRAQVEQVAATMRRKKIPCDAIYFDIHHMDGCRVFTFGKTFPKPKELITNLARDGFKVVTIVDPGVKNDPKFGVLKRGIKAGAFVKEPAGKKDFIGAVWPGKSRFPDFLNETARNWWAREQGALSRQGVAGFWNDMNEPANFARSDKTLHPRAQHRPDHGIARHEDVHNVYGSLMAQASREGALKAEPDKRPFIITRAGYTGVQRHAMVWTGDNSSTWQHFEDSIQSLLNLSVSGVPFCGCDAGGFLDNCTPELFVRWMQCAAFMPFFRSHTNIGTIDQEPWSFGAEAEAIVRHYIELRYQLMPYLYSLFAEAARSSAPIIRPLFWHHADDLTAVDTPDQFLLGRDLMIVPILKQGSVARCVYLPAGDWYEFWSGEKIVGRQHVVAPAPLQFLPMFVRAGAVIPFGDIQQFVGEKPVKTITLHHWTGGAGSLKFYDDDGASMDFENGDFIERSILSASSDNGGKLVISDERGNHRTTITRWRTVLHGLTANPRFKLNGKRVAVGTDSATGLPACEWENTTGETELTWT